MKGVLILAWFLACSPLETRCREGFWLRVKPWGRRTFLSLSQHFNCVPTVPGSLLDLSSMIEDVTGKPALKSFGFYGCYCGWGGKGTPVDAIDWCCWRHDVCYAELERKGCNVLTQSYRYRVRQGLVTCELGSHCQMELCACDQKLVHCLKRNRRSYSPLYQYFPNFLCI